MLLVKVELVSVKVPPLLYIAPKSEITLVIVISLIINEPLSITNNEEMLSFPLIVCPLPSIVIIWPLSNMISSFGYNPDSNLLLYLDLHV